jgi:protocatechuate 3,4-dioxygenase beta subunit
MWRLLAVFTLALTPTAAAQTPPRDAAESAKTGTAIIRGRVLAADTGKPLRRARIQLTAPELAGAPRNTSTDADGRYEFMELPAGRFTIRVTRSGYLSLAYGQRRPREAAKPLQLADQEVLERVDVALPRMAVISGRIVDEMGDPIEGVNARDASDVS